MTHLGDNPFQGSSDITVSDNDIAAFFDGELDRELDQEIKNHRGSELLQAMQAVVDAHGLPRVFDESLEREGELEEARLQTLREEVTDVLSQAEVATGLDSNDSLHAVIELRTSMLLIEERRFQQALISLAMRLTDNYDSADEEKKPAVLADVIHEKKVYLALLTGHYGFELAGWPAVFDEITPGTAITLDFDTDIDEFHLEAELIARRIIAKERQEEIERDSLARLVGAEHITDADELMSVMISIAVIQEEVDIIELVQGISAQEVRREAICSIGSQAGFTDEMCQKLVAYYNQKHPLQM
jgi:hypothetical protein